jgi:CRISPR-associated protein Cas5d
MRVHNYLLQMEIEGKTAMWTRPDTGDAPVSAPAPSYAAVKAVFESVLLGFKTIVDPVKVEICAPLQYNSYYTNYGGPLRKGEAVKDGNSFQLLATVLIDVCYRFYAEIIPNKQSMAFSKKTTEWDKRTTSPGHAYQEIFNRRLARGQCYAVPFLGWKEFTPSYFGPFREKTRVQTDFSTKIPSMVRQVFSHGYNSEVSIKYDQNVEIKNGILLFRDGEIKDGE